MAADDAFFKFPRTEHLEGSTVVDDDKSMGWRAAQQVCKKEGTTLIVQEKVIHSEKQYTKCNSCVRLMVLMYLCTLSTNGRQFCRSAAV